MRALLLIRLLALSLLPLALATACAGERLDSGERPDSAAARPATERLWADVAGIFLRGDSEAIPTVYTEDAALITEQMEIRGRAAIRANFEGVYSRIIYRSFEHTTERFETDGEMAIGQGVFGGTTEAKEEPGVTTSTSMRYVIVYKRQPDGRWLFHYVVTLPRLPASAK